MIETEGGKLKKGNIHGLVLIFIFFLIALAWAVLHTFLRRLRGRGDLVEC